MKQKREIYQEAYQIINQRHSQAVQEGERRRRELMKSLPEAVDLQDRIAKTAIAYTRLVLSHDATLEEMLPSLQQENLRLQQQMGRVLTLAGYPENYLDIPYTCPLCRDTGFDETGERCACYQKLVRDITAQEFNKNSPMGARRFEDFRLDFYPEGVRESMGKVLTFCQRYSQDFSLSSPSLLMMGATGLGKSHLSLAIAAEVVQRGIWCSMVRCRICSAPFKTSITAGARAIFPPWTPCARQTCWCWMTLAVSTTPRSKILPCFPFSTIAWNSKSPPSSAPT